MAALPFSHMVPPVLGLRSRGVLAPAANLLLLAVPFAWFAPGAAPTASSMADAAISLPPCPLFSSPRPPAGSKQLGIQSARAQGVPSRLLRLLQLLPSPPFACSTAVPLQPLIDDAACLCGGAFELPWPPQSQNWLFLVAPHRSLSLASEDHLPPPPRCVVLDNFVSMSLSALRGDRVVQLLDSTSPLVPELIGIVNCWYRAVEASHNTPHITTHSTQSSPASISLFSLYVDLIDMNERTRIAILINTGEMQGPPTHHALLTGSQETESNPPPLPNLCVRVCLSPSTEPLTIRWGLGTRTYCSALAGAHPRASSDRGVLLWGLGSEPLGPPGARNENYLVRGSSKGTSHIANVRGVDHYGGHMVVNQPDAARGRVVLDIPFVKGGIVHTIHWIQIQPPLLSKVTDCTDPELGEIFFYLKSNNIMSSNSVHQAYVSNLDHLCMTGTFSICHFVASLDDKNCDKLVLNSLKVRKITPKININNECYMHIKLCVSLIFTLILPHLSHSTKSMKVKRTGGGKYKSTKILSSKLSVKVCLLLLLIIVLPPVQGAPRGRGGPSTSSSVPATPRPADFIPNMSRDWDFLPGMKRWNGIPFYEFLRVWFFALTAALGTVVQEGHTLLECAQGKDSGSQNDDTDEDKRKHNVRNSRLFACILNYINPTSQLAKTLKEELLNDGKSSYEYIKTFGDLKLDDTERIRLTSEWDEATLTKVGIKIDSNSLFEWLEYIHTLGDKIGRSLKQKRKKFLEGLPQAFESIAAIERLQPYPGSFKYPNQYPTDHPYAGKEHPKRGEPDLMALALAFYPEWNTALAKGTLKPAPRGSVHLSSTNDSFFNNEDNHVSEADDEQLDEDLNEMTLYTKSNKFKSRSNQVGKISSRSVCGICGGLGHYGSVDGKDCLTKRLGIKVSKDTLTQIKYPDGISYPFKTNPSFSQQSNAVKHKSLRSRTPKGKRPIKPKRRVYLVESGDSSCENEHVGPSEDKHGINTAQQAESSSSSEVEIGKFAVAYHTINTRKSKYQSYSSDNDEQ